MLLVDLRGHGVSEGSLTTLGGLEAHDVRAGAGLAHTGPPPTAGIGLMGHSMGAVAVLLAAADQPDVRAVIVEAPFDQLPQQRGPPREAAATGCRRCCP